MSNSYYEILGLANDASKDEIKKAYRSLSMKWHPDRNTASDANGIFQKINEAYETLSDDSKPKISLEGDEKSRPSRTKDPLPILMKSALPRWNLKYGTLVMDFQGTRVKLASSKNFLMYAPAHLGKKVPILQVGKAKKRRYHMDFRAPLSPIQAFAISVSSFIWKKDKKKTSK